MEWKWTSKPRGLIILRRTIQSYRNFPTHTQGQEMKSTGYTIIILQEVHSGICSVEMPASQIASHLPTLKSGISQQALVISCLKHNHWNISSGDPTELYQCFKWRQSVLEEDLKILKVEYLSNSKYIKIRSYSNFKLKLRGGFQKNKNLIFGL